MQNDLRWIDLGGTPIVQVVERHDQSTELKDFAKTKEKRDRSRLIDRKERRLFF